MPADDTPHTHCHICGAKLDPTLLGGGCPACLWSDIISGESDEQSSLEDAPEIEGYDVLEEIGAGGMGLVYRARQHQPDREVALKIVAPYSLRAAQARQRFMVEVEAMAAVEHPALLPLYDAGEDKHGRPWLTMQLAQGGTLADRLENYHGDWKSIARLLVTLCHAVHYAHERGILHRDLKPANILFDNEDNAYIADFGLAKWADDDGSITRSSYLLGSPAYLAPEAAAGGSKVTTTVSDVYGLGAVLYELLCGEKPYDGTVAAEILTQILDHSPVSPRAKLPNIPRDLEIIVMKAMAREPGKRYHSAAAYAADLTRWLNGKAILARAVGPLERGWLWAKRNPALSLLSLLLLTSLITGGVLLWNANHKLTVALDDAEDRVDFMTRELPARLEPLGRLDLLDDVFENVSEHYAMDTRTDPDSLARHADFLTQWSQILRPRGKIKEAIKRLDRAMIKAKEATSGSHPPLEASRSRIATGRRFGEALIEDYQFDLARATLIETATFSEQVNKEYSEDLRLAQLTAELVLERAILERKADEPEQALIMGDRAMEMWVKITPRMLKNPDSPHHQSALITAAMTHNILSKIHEKLQNSEEEKEYINSYLKATEELMKISSGNLHFRHEYVIARQIYLRHHLLDETMSLEEGVKSFKEVDDDIVFLVSQDSGNIRWQTDSVTNAIRLHQILNRQDDQGAADRWLDVASDRMTILYKTESNDLDFLYAHRSSGDHCATSYNKTNWPKAKYHFLASAKIQMKICSLDPSDDTHRSLQKGTKSIAKQYFEQEGKKQAVDWLLGQAKTYRDRSDSLEPSVYWKWSEAVCYTDSLKYDNESADAVARAQQGFSLLMGIGDQAEGIPEFSDDVYTSTKLYLELLSENSAEELTILSQLLDIIPNLRKKANPDMDKNWLELIIRHSTKIPTAQRQSIIDRSVKAFFPKPETNNPLYQQLQQLR